MKAYDIIDILRKRPILKVVAIVGAVLIVSMGFPPRQLIPRRTGEAISRSGEVQIYNTCFALTGPDR